MLTIKQDNRYKAYSNLYQALLLDPAPYATDKAMQDIVARLGLSLDAIGANLTPGTRPTKGITQDKSAARDTLATVAAELAGDVFAYATKLKNATLQAEADFSQTDFAKMPATRLDTLVGLLLQRLQDHQAALTDYDVTAARVQELTDARATFNAQRNAPRQQVSQNAAVRVSTGEHFRQLGTLVRDELQRALRKYERRAPDFYTRIVSAREVIDRRNPGAPPTPPQA